jgi:hypothetical protein
MASSHVSRMKHVKGMECSVPREDNMGYLGRYPKGIIIDRWPHSVKAIIVRRITRRFLH